MMLTVKIAFIVQMQPDGRTQPSFRLILQRIATYLTISATRTDSLRPALSSAGAPRCCQCGHGRSLSTPSLPLPLPLPVSNRAHALGQPARHRITVTPHAALHLLSKSRSSAAHHLDCLHLTLMGHTADRTTKSPFDRRHTQREIPLVGPVCQGPTP
ncbi:hypothetical protein LIA77_08231 [Sarocladium implicatum]|nr:hypothetical protein LIA77_08231 [Sarocladium implicatum]